MARFEFDIIVFTPRFNNNDAKTKKWPPQENHSFVK